MDNNINIVDIEPIDDIKFHTMILSLYSNILLGALHWNLIINWGVNIILIFMNNNKPKVFIYFNYYIIITNNIF